VITGHSPEKIVRYPPAVVIFTNGIHHQMGFLKRIVKSIYICILFFL